MESNYQTRLPRRQKGQPPLILKRSVENYVLGIIEAIRNMKVHIQYTDGTHILSTFDADVKVSDGGCEVVIPIGVPGSGGSGSVNVQTFTVSSQNATYWVCSGTNVFKPSLLQCNYYTRNVIAADGSTQTVNYAYTVTGGLAFQQRTASVTGYDTETHMVTPSMNTGDTILAVQIGSDWYDMNVDGRRWSAVPVNPPP